MDDGQRIARIRELAEKITISGMRMLACAKNYYEEPMATRDGDLCPCVQDANKGENIRESILSQDEPVKKSAEWKPTK